MNTLKQAPIGSICFWDTHYSFRPEYKMDVPIQFFYNNNDFRFIREFVADGGVYQAFVFVKIGNTY